MGFFDFWRKREIDPFAEVGTSSSIGPQVAAFWDSLRGYGFSPRLIERVWAANRCVQLNAQQIASMPLQFTGPPSAQPPAWVSNPDPSWYPNGVRDAVFAIVKSVYAWGDAFVYILDRYADGFARTWTVLDPSAVTVTLDDRGRRSYRSGETELERGDVVQITRDPGWALRGTSALSAYASQMLSSVASSDLGKTIADTGAPTSVLKSTRKMTQAQATLLKEQWVLAAASRRGEPIVLPPELDFSVLSFSPKDLQLLEVQEFNARVIASAFGVPPYMLNLPLTGGLTYQNPAMLGEQWWRFELRTTADRISGAFSAQMLPAGQSVEFDAHDTFAPLEPDGRQEITNQGSATPNVAASPNQNGTGSGTAVMPMLASIG